MKTMEVSKEDDDCDVIETVPVKQKKLKQALLPFQTLSAPESIGLKNKKRKLSSSSPSGCKNEKISKIARKENLLTASNDIEKNNESKENEKNHDSEEENDDDDDEKDKKDEEKSVMKPNALLKYLKKTSESSIPVITNKKEKNIPIIVLNRCDQNIRKDQDNSSQNHQSGDTVQMVENNEHDQIKMDETSEDSIDISVDPDKEDDCKEIQEESNENIDNSDTETESSLSEDDDNDDKKSNDDASEVSGRENGSNIERTPTSDKNSEKKMHKNRRLTPKQLERKMESEKKREERQKLKAERDKQRTEEKMKRRAKREAEREQKRKQREEKKLKKQMEIEQKQEEKERKEKAKEEDRRKKEEAKEEEKKKKEEERLETERKKQKAASTFKSFFVPKNQETKSVEEKNSGACNFMPFEIKADMKIAPTCRRTFSNDEKTSFETLYLKNNEKPKNLYLEEIKTDKSKLRRSGKTWPVEAKDDVMILEDDDVDNTNLVDQTSCLVEKHRPKLIAFSENRRPPYWGTWGKKSCTINPRRPFAKDTTYFDYEIDSDDEWEEEEPGESLRGSDDEKEKDPEDPGDDEYDIDNDFMVPHGYLSDEEARADDEDKEKMSPETQKYKLKILGEQFEAEMNAKTAKIKPKVIGCIWQGPLHSYPEKTPTSVVNFLTQRKAWVKETPIVLEAIINSDSSNSIEAPSNSKKEKEKLTPKRPKKSSFPDKALPDLIRLLHGNLNGRSFLIKEFITYWNRKYPEEEQLSLMSVGKRIRELAKRILCPEEGPMHLKACWYVHEDIRKKYEVEELTLPNKWIYKLIPKKKSKVVEATEPGEKIEKEVDREKEKDQKDKEKEKKTTPLITQFTKKITQEEMKKQLSVKPTPSSTTKPSIIPNKPGKRVALISVARGEQLPKSTIASAFSKISQNTKNPSSIPGSSNLPITIEDSPVKNDSTSQETDHNVLTPKTMCNIIGDKDSIKENQSTEVNNKPDQMEVE